ncbi:hypothetical protein ACYOEI_21755 [Singulisphaera rosea]
MVGERLEARSRFPLGAILLLAFALVFGAIDAIQGRPESKHDIFTFLILPFILGLTSLVRGRERRLSATFQADGIEVEGDNGPSLIPYASLRNVWANGRSPDPTGFQQRSCRIAVLHEGGMLRIPPRSNIPSHKTYQFLTGQVQANGGRDVNPNLREYLERQERFFGQENVWTYQAATQRPPTPHSRARTVAIGLLATGVIWAALGFTGTSSSSWGGAGITCMLFAALVFLVTYAQMSSIRSLPGGWRKASLVIGPQGLAMVQGELQGEIRWTELLDVLYMPKVRSFSITIHRKVPGIVLRVKGAEFVIIDAYDRPLYVIHEQIRVSSGRFHPPVEAEL